MYDEMGSFRIKVAVENPAVPGVLETFQSVLVDTGAELSVFPAPALDALGIVRLKPLRFRQADGTVFQRWTGSARIYAANTVATDDVVFGEPGDLMLLGARSLEGLNVRIDPVSKQLVDAGPMPLAVVTNRLQPELEYVRSRAHAKSNCRSLAALGMTDRYARDDSASLRRSTRKSALS